jgi:outer membrane protein assembly factor BamB
MSKDLLIIGIGGYAVGIDPSTGAERWRTKLKGHSFVTIHEIGSQIFAGARGVLFFLEPSTGQIIWKNELRGLGAGLIAFTSSNESAAAADVEAQEQAAGVAAAGS